MCIFRYLALAITFFLLCWYFACKPTSNYSTESRQNGGATRLERNGSVSAKENEMNGMDNPVGVKEIICDEVETTF